MLSTTSKIKQSARASLRKRVRRALERPPEILPEIGTAPAPAYADIERSSSMGRGSVVLPLAIAAGPGAIAGEEWGWESPTWGRGLVVAIEPLSGSPSSVSVIIGCPPAGTVSFDKEMAPLISSHKRHIAAGSHEED